MRDPLAPIPSPARDPGFWQTTSAPRATRLPSHLRPGAHDDEYAPMRLLGRDQGDTHGLDRRAQRRPSMHAPAPGEEHGTDRLLSAAHRRLDLVLGLSTRHGWAIVRTLSMAPAGLLLLRRLAPMLGAPLRATTVHEPGSPLATVGGCLLAPRVVADLSCWASKPVARRGTSTRRPATLTVTLLQLTGMPGIEGELVPMTDPQPQVLAVALTPAALAQLERAAASPGA
jgi:hypothetical protein